MKARGLHSWHPLLTKHERNENSPWKGHFLPIGSEGQLQRFGIYRNRNEINRSRKAFSKLGYLCWLPGEDSNLQPFG